MRTGLVRKYGERETVPQYIEIAIKHHGCSKLVSEIALRMYHRIGQNTPFSGRAPSMTAMAIVHLAAMECFQRIPSTVWSGYDSCSYPTLIKHSKELKKTLEKLPDFPNLKNRVIGR